MIGLSRFNILVSGKTCDSLALRGNNGLYSITGILAGGSKDEVNGNMLFESYRLIFHTVEIRVYIIILFLFLVFLFLINNGTEVNLHILMTNFGLKSIL